ncbi:MAG: hypothetical protein AAF799_06585 [Myxococcota bacterium]
MMRLPRRTPRFALFLTLGALSTGCPSDDAPADTDEASTGASSTGGMVEDSGSSAATPPGTTGSTDPGSTTDTPADSSGGEDDTTTGEPPPSGVCVGIDTVGDIGSVYTSLGPGGPPPPMCGAEPAGCGGDLVGTWQVQQVCGFDALPNPLEDDCPGSQFDVEILSSTGSLEFLEDGTYVQDTTIANQVILTLDSMTCYGATCEEFAMFVEMDTPGATCQDVGPGMCECTLPNPAEVSLNMGTYSTDGNTLTLNGDDGSFEEFEYCAMGNALQTWAPLYDFVVTEQGCELDEECEAALGDMHEFYVCAQEEDLEE